MEPVHTAGVLSHQIVAMVADQANHAGQVLGLDPAKAPMMPGDQSDGRRVVDVGLAAMPSESSRARAAKVAGTSTTSWPRATGVAQCPAPGRLLLPPPTAVAAIGQRTPQPSVAVFTESRTVPTIVPSGLVRDRREGGLLCGSIPMVIMPGLQVANGWGSAVGNLTSGHLMPLLSHTAAGAGGSGRLSESQPEGGKEHCEPIPPAPSADYDEAAGACHYGKKSGACAPGAHHCLVHRPRPRRASAEAVQRKRQGMTSMTSPSTRIVIGGVDTHGHTHHAAVIDKVGPATRRSGVHRHPGGLPRVSGMA